MNFNICTRFSDNPSRYPETIIPIMIKIASDSIEKKKIECYPPNMTWNDSQENTKILTEWKGYI